MGNEKSQSLWIGGHCNGEVGPVEKWVLWGGGCYGEVDLVDRSSCGKVD